MEHIGKALGNYHRGTDTQDQRILEPEPVELTLEEKREELRKSLGVSSLENTFENFKLVAGTKEALATFKALASGKTPWKMALIYGGVGNGKSHLCEATAIELYKRGIFCRVLTMAEIMRSLKAAIEHDKHGNEGKPWVPYAQLLNDLGSRGYLIIDDVGMGTGGSEWDKDRLEEIIVARYRENLFTIMTTNRDPEDLEVRIVSRFRDPDKGRVVLNEGDDYRGLK